MRSIANRMYSSFRSNSLGIHFYIETTLNVVVEGLTLLLRIQMAQGSNDGTDTDYPE
jgi:hypothetical protein